MSPGKSGVFAAVTDRPLSGLRRSRAVLVTGAGGEMGHSLIQALAREGTSVVAMDIRELEPGVREHCENAFVGDVCDAQLLERLLAMYEVDEVFHLAALLSTRGEFAPETAHQVNVVGTLNLLKLAAEQARSHGRPVKFVFPSPIAAYGIPDLDTKRKAGAVKEDQLLEPHTMYGVQQARGRAPRPLLRGSLPQAREGPHREADRLQVDQVPWHHQRGDRAVGRNERLRPRDDPRGGGGQGVPLLRAAGLAHPVHDDARGDRCSREANGGTQGIALAKHLQRGQLLAECG